MKPTSKPVSVNATSIENYLWEVHRVIMLQYGCYQASVDIAPLSWYIGGRASVEHTRSILSFPPRKMAQLLHAGGSYDEILASIRKRLKFDE